MLRILCPLIMVFVLFASSQFAVAAGEIDEPTADERFVRALQSIDASQFEAAIRDLRNVVTDDPLNADAWNWLGFAARNVGEFDLSWDAYDRALAIDPEHLGAMNYLGHLYVAKTDWSSAAEMLTRIQETCGQCDEMTSLAAALAEQRP